MDFFNSCVAYFKSLQPNIIKNNITRKLLLNCRTMVLSLYHNTETELKCHSCKRHLEIDNCIKFGILNI